MIIYSFQFQNDDSLVRNNRLERSTSNYFQAQ